VLSYDITDRKAIEEALRESHLRLQKAMDVETVGVLFFDDQLTFTAANDAFLKMSGYTRQQLETDGLQYEDITLPEWMPRTRESLEQLKASGRATPYEKELQRPDGSRWWGLFAAARLGPRENVEYVFDVTERRNTEVALGESEERYRLFIESVEDYAIFMMDTRGIITSWNSGVERVLGYGENEFLGQVAARLFTPEDRQKGEPEKEMATAAREGRAPDERWHVKKSGERFYASGVLMAMRGENGELHGFAKILRDVTVRKQMEDELLAAHDELEARVQERTLELAMTNAELEINAKELRQSEVERRLLLQRVVSTQEEERRRISRELHDEMGQHLTALLMGLKALPAALPAAQQIKNLQSLADELMSHTHRLAWQMRPAVLDTIGLEAALEQYVREWSEQNGIAGDFISRGLGGERLPEEMEITFYRVVQEALTNVKRHANARSVSVVLEREGDSVAAIIEDDGDGFNNEGDGQSTQRSRRLGILGMRERLELIGGSLTIESAPGEGTTVYARTNVKLLPSS
jgi:PAS domain S-box-containing protein